MSPSSNRIAAAIERPDQQRARPMVGDRPAGIGRQDGSSLHTRRLAACLLLDSAFASAHIPSRVDATRRCVIVSRVGRRPVEVWPLLRSVDGEQRWLVESDGRRIVGPAGLVREVR